MVDTNSRICQSLAKFIANLPSYDIYSSRADKRETQRRQKHMLHDAAIALADEILPESKAYGCDELTGLLIGFKANLKWGISNKARNPGDHRDIMIGIWSNMASDTASVYGVPRGSEGAKLGNDLFPPMHGGWSIHGDKVKGVVKDVIKESVEAIPIVGDKISARI